MPEDAAPDMPVGLTLLDAHGIQDAVNVRGPINQRIDEGCTDAFDEIHQLTQRLGAGHEQQVVVDDGQQGNFAGLGFDHDGVWVTSAVHRDVAVETRLNAGQLTFDQLDDIAVALVLLEEATEADGFIGQQSQLATEGATSFTLDLGGDFCGSDLVAQYSAGRAAKQLHHFQHAGQEGNSVDALAMFPALSLQDHFTHGTRSMGGVDEGVVLDVSDAGNAEAGVNAGDQEVIFTGTHNVRSAERRWGSFQGQAGLNSTVGQADEGSPESMSSQWIFNMDVHSDTNLIKKWGIKPGECPQA